jgi:hypothetical protein
MSIFFGMKVAVLGLVSAGGLGAYGQAAAVAQSKTVSTEVITGVTVESVQKRIQAMGFDCTRGKDDKGQDNNYFVFKAEGFKVIVFVPSSTTVEVDTVFDDVHPSLASINEWNRDNRFSRAYIEKDGSADLEDDLDLASGVTAEGFEGFIKTFRSSVTRWAHFVVEHNEKPAAAGQ